MKRIEPTGNNGSRSPAARQISIGGPRLWLAYAAAAGTGMCSVTFAGWVRGGLGMPSLAEAACEGILLTGAFLLAGFGVFLFGAWSFTRRRFEHDPDLPECRRLLILVYAAMVPTIFFAAMAPTILDVLDPFRGKLGSPPGPPTSYYFAMLGWVMMAALAPVQFAVRDPRHGFFCAGLISVVSYSTLFELMFVLVGEESSALYLITARMALVFIYLTTDIRIQRVVAGLCGVVSVCSPGVLGAVVGTISWSVRRRTARQKQARRAEKESVEGSISAQELGVTVENRSEPSTDDTD